MSFIKESRPSRSSGEKLTNDLKDHLCEMNPKIHLKDARVHCVVLKVRAVPSPRAVVGRQKRP